MQPLLTIQIPFTEERREETDKLTAWFWYQIDLFNLSGLVEIQADGRGRQISIGQKRTDLYKAANGLFVVQWDSDDWVSDEGVYDIVNAIKKTPEVDCVTYEEHVHINGVNYTSNHSILYHDWEGEGNTEFADGFNFHRTPYMKSVIKTEIAKSVPVPDCRFSEDHQWSKLIKPLLKTEHHIEEEIYHYIYISNQTFEERYGHDGH